MPLLFATSRQAFKASDVFRFLLILIITIPRAATKFDDVGILKTTTKVFGMFFNDGFARKGLLGRERSAFREANLSAVLLGFPDTLANTAMKVGDFFFSLVEGGFDLFFGKS